jgi:TonB family protein
VRLRTRVFLLGALACTHAPAHHDATLQPVDSLSAVDSLLLPPDSAFKVEQVETPPWVLSCPRPDYPPAARASGMQGRVLVQMIVDTLGRPEPKTISILESPGLDLSLSARAAARGCLFGPARIHGRAVRVIIRMPYYFAVRR